MNQEEWLQINTFVCPHGLGRLSPEQCEANRRRSERINGFKGDLIKPFACRECTEWKTLCTEVKKRREEKMAGRMIICPECGKEAPNYGRGLCQKCYRKLSKEGRLPPKLKDKKKEKAGGVKIELHFPESMACVFEKIRKKAEDEIRTVQEQILWELKKAIGGKHEERENRGL